MAKLLKPCPLCGERDINILVDIVQCSECGLTIARSTLETAIDAWNCRHGEDALRTRVDALEGKLHVANKDASKAWLALDRIAWHLSGGTCGNTSDMGHRDMPDAVFGVVCECDTLRARIDALESLAKVAREVAVSALPSFSGGRPTVDNDAIVALRHAIADMEVHSAS